VLAESGTVALTTKLPWTIMLLIAVAAYLVGRVIRERLPLNPTRVTLLILWLLAPPVLIYLVLRDPSFDMGHVVSTDLPIFAAYAVGGSLLLSWLTRPSTGEAGRIVAVVILIVGFCTFLTPMRMVVRLDMLLLAVFALAAPTFAGGPRNRKRYVLGWLGVLGVMSWLITAINTPSTVPVPGRPGPYLDHAHLPTACHLVHRIRARRPLDHDPDLLLDHGAALPATGNAPRGGRCRGHRLRAVLSGLSG
jgi:hypothetical protein